MPVANGDYAAKPAQGKQVLDYKTALDVLERDYEHGDGLDIKTLLDSTQNGALTYNDFLILPGYIGICCTMSSSLR